MTFQIRGDKTWCNDCGAVIPSTWQAKTAHCCSRRARLERADYTAALSYADAVARLQSRCDTIRKEA